MKTAIKFAIGLFTVMTAHWSIAAPVAMVMDLQGKVSVNGGTSELLAEVDAKSRVSVEKGGSITLVYLGSGEEFVLTGPQTAVVGEKDVMSDQKVAKSTTMLASVQGLESSKFSQAAIVMRSGGSKEDSLKMISPKSSKILSSNPSLKWQSMGRGYTYRVEVLSEYGDSLFAVETKKTSVDIPANVQLPRGELLSWEIEAVKGAAIHYNIADFFIAEQNEVDLIEKNRPGNQSSFSEMLLFAWNLEKRGLKEEAQSYWHKLAKLRPKDKIIQSKLK